jgi:hypothetical protein
MFVPDARHLRVHKYLTSFGDRCLYRYDFGDDREHEVKFEQPVDLDEVFKRRLLAGERLFPPEDCGGHSGYDECLLAVGERPSNPYIGLAPSPEDLEERRTWLGDWTPEFDLEAASEAVSRPAGSCPYPSHVAPGTTLP